MLGQPALLPRQVGADAQGQALLGKKNIPAVTGADRNDRVVLREMANQAACRVQLEEGMRSAIPFRLRFGLEQVERHLPHAGHDPHAQDNVDGIGDLKPDLGQRRPGRPHDVGNDEEGSTPHRALEHLVQPGVGLARVGPVVGRAGFLLCRGADESELFHPGDVVRMGAVQVGPRFFLLVKLEQGALEAGLSQEVIVFLLRAVAPENVVGIGQGLHLVHPVEDFLEGELFVADSGGRRDGRRKVGHRRSGRRGSRREHNSPCFNGKAK